VTALTQQQQSIFHKEKGLPEGPSRMCLTIVGLLNVFIFGLLAYAILGAE